MYYYTASQKMHKLWNGIAQNHIDWFRWHLAEIFKRLQNRVFTFSFHVGLLFLSTFRLSNQTQKIMPILTLQAYQANAPTLTKWNFLKHALKVMIFGTYNLQTFKHNKLINKLLLMHFHLINICPKLHHWKWRKLCITVPVNMSTTLNFLNITINPVLHPTFIAKLCYKLPNIVTFTFIRIFDQNFVYLSYTISK